MFGRAIAFNSDLSQWNVAKVTIMTNSTFQFPLFNSPTPQPVLFFFVRLKIYKRFLSSHLLNLPLLPPLFLFRFLIVVLREATAFNRTWCDPIWSEKIAASDFMGSDGFAFCCLSGKHVDLNDNYDPASQKITCAPCSLGRYTGDPSLTTTCQGCPSGWFQPKERQQFCYPCNPGKHQFQEGRDSCLSCGEGTFMPDATSNSVTCKSCPAGYYVNGNEATKCQACEEGKYSEEERAASSKTCLECSKGTYSSSKAATECQPW